MEKSIQNKVKLLLIISIGVQVISSLYYGFQLSASIRNLNFAGLAVSPYGSMIEYSLFEFIHMGLLVVVFGLLIKNLDKLWAELGSILAFLFLLPTWSALFSVYGIYFIYQNSTRLKTFVNELKAQ